MVFFRASRRFRRWEELSTMAVALAFLGPIWMASDLLPGTGTVVFTVIMVVVTSRAVTPASDRPVPLLISWDAQQSYRRRELERRRDLFDAAPTRHLLPVVASLIFLLTAFFFRYTIAGELPVGIPPVVGGVFTLLACGLVLGTALYLRTLSRRARTTLENEILLLDRAP